MAIPLTIFFTLYGAAVIVFLILSFFLLYHAVRFGQITPLNFSAMVVFTAGAAALIYYSAHYIDAHDWSQTIDVAGFVKSIFF